MTGANFGKITASHLSLTSSSLRRSLSCTARRCESFFVAITTQGRHKPDGQRKIITDNINTKNSQSVFSDSMRQIAPLSLEYRDVHFEAIHCKQMNRISVKQRDA